MATGRDRKKALCCEAVSFLYRNEATSRAVASRAGEEEGKALRERDWCGQAGNKGGAGREERRHAAREGDDPRGVALRGRELLAWDSYRRARFTLSRISHDCLA